MATDGGDNPKIGSDVGAGPSLSQNLYSDFSFTQALSQPTRTAGDNTFQSIVADNPYKYYGEVNDTPMLDEGIKEQLTASDQLQFSTPIDNQASGEKPDYKLVMGTDGKLRLEPTGDGDPLADGKINIEIDENNKSLAEAIKNADANQKEYIREMMQYWQKNHPGEPHPGWWDDVLNGQPNIPQNVQPVPRERTPEQFRPQPSPMPEPPQTPDQGWQQNYRQGGGRGYGSEGSWGGGGGGGGGGRRGYYGGGDMPDTPSVPNYVPNFKDPTGFIDKLTNTIMANEGALNADGSPKFNAFNPDDKGGISVGIRQWHAGGALPELLNAWKDADPQKFQQYFHGLSPAQINSMSSQEFNSRPELVQGMKDALNDKQYQGVQSELMTNWVKREVKLAMDQGLTGEKEIATYVDVANQFGQTKADEIAKLGKGEGDQAQQMNEAARGGQFGERIARIDNTFSNQVAQLEPKDGGNEAIVQMAQQGLGRQLWAQTPWARYCEGGNLGCAASVSLVLQRAGFQYAQSAGVSELSSQLQRNGWQRVPLSQAQPGDVLYNSHHIGIKAPEGDMIYDNSSSSTVWSHRRIGSSGLSDGPVYALRPPGDGGTQYARNNSRNRGNAA